MRKPFLVGVAFFLSALFVASVAAADSSSPLAGPVALEVGPRHGPEKIEDATLPRARAGSSYSYQFKSDQQPPPKFSLNEGELPDGLSLTEDGLLSGVPTTSGRYFFVVVADNGVLGPEDTQGTAQNVSMDVVAPPKLTLESPDPATPTAEVLNGQVNPGNLPVDVWFEYWPTAAPTPQKTRVESIEAGVKPVQVAAEAADLTTAVEYTFRLAATSELSANPVYTETATFKTDLPPPEAGQSFNIEPVEGSVSTKCNGEGDFSRLEKPKQVTLDCQIDTSHGTVSLTASKGSSGETQSALFWGGLFSVYQEAGDNKEAVLNLSGGLRCERRKTKSGKRVLVRGRKGGGGRQLWGSGKGNYKTVGSHGAGTVRGTIWLVQDRCDGSTFFKVKRGTVVVRDFVKKTSVILEAGESYVAKVVGGRLP